MKSPSGRMRVTAQVGVELPAHERLLVIASGVERAAALGVWTAATCASRMREKDGFCALEWLVGYASEEIISRLVDVGLFAREEQNGVHGVRVLRFEEFNETKSQIERRLKRDRVRKKASRDARNVHAGSARTSAGLPEDIREESERNSAGSPERRGEGEDLICGSEGEPERESETTRVDDYRRAYEAGIRRATRKPWAMPRGKEGDLHQAIQVFSGGRRGAELDAWISDESENFAKFLASEPEDQRKFWSNGAPTGFLRWLNERSMPGRTAPAESTAVVAERARREREFAEAKRNAVPMPAGQLFAAIGGGRKP